MNIFDPQCAIYFENTIAMRDRVAFICVLVEDMNLLIKLTDQQQLNINVVHSNRRSKSSDYQPIIPIEALSKYGFHSYMTSLYEAPEPIMTYLSQNYNLHNIPVGLEKTNRYFDQLPKDITVFFSGK